MSCCFLRRSNMFSDHLTFEGYLKYKMKISEFIPVYCMVFAKEKKQQMIDQLVQRLSARDCCCWLLRNFQKGKVKHWNGLYAVYHYSYISYTIAYLNIGFIYMRSWFFYIMNFPKEERQKRNEISFYAAKCFYGISQRKNGKHVIMWLNSH